MRTRSGQPSGTGSGSESTGYSSGGSTGGESESAGYSSSGRSGGTGLERSGRGATGQHVTPRRWVRGGPMLATPWDLMRRASEEMARLLESIEPGRTGMGPTGSTLDRASSGPERGSLSTGMFVPPIEVEQRSDSVVVRTDLPGIEPDQINVTVNEGVLNISGERTQEQREEREGYIRSERRYGSFYRAIPLPDGADEDHVNASYDNGVLEITVPVSGRAQGRQIPVQSTGSRGRTEGEGRTGGTAGQGRESYSGQSTSSSQHSSQTQGSQSGREESNR